MNKGGFANNVTNSFLSNFSTAEGDNNFTYSEVNALNFNSTHHIGAKENSSRSDNLNVSVTDVIYFPPQMITFGAICMILMATFAIVGNFISICALSKPKHLKRITTLLVVNLCVADFFLSCCTLTSSVFVYRSQHWNGGDDACKFYNILIFFFASISVLTVTTITVNRYVLIVHPRFYHAIFRMRNTVILIGSLWMISTALTLLSHFKIWGKFGYDPNTGECAIIDRDGKSEIYIYIVAYFGPLLLFILCYTKIFYVVRKTEKNTRRHAGNILSHLKNFSDKYWHPEQENETAKTSYLYLRNTKERRLFQIILIIFVLFILCFIPVSVVKMLQIEREYPSLYIICHLGVHLSNVVNPIVYIVMSEEYRKAYLELLCCRKTY